MTTVATSLRPYEIGRFLGIKSAYGPSFLPDGRLAFVSNLGGVAQVYAIPAEPPSGGSGDGAWWPEQLTFSQDRIGAVYASPNDARLIVAGDHLGDERFQLHLVSGNGEAVTALTTEPDVMYHFGGWSPDGGRIAYAGNGRDPRQFDVFVHDLATGDVRLVWQTGGMHYPLCWSPEGTHVLVERIEGNADQDLYEVPVDGSGAVRHLTPRAGGSRPARWTAAHYSPDGRSVYALTDRDTDTLALARIDRQTLDVETLFSGEWDVEDALVSPDGSRIAYSVNAGGYSELYVRTLASGDTVRLDLPPGTGSLGRDLRRRDVLAWSGDSARLAFSRAGARATRNVWIASFPAGTVGTASTTGALGTAGKAGTPRRVTAASHAGMSPERLAEPQLVHYPTFDGREIPAFLYVPPGASPDASRPAVVYFHGGPEMQIRPDLGTIEPQFFTQRGYVVLTPNVRGSSGYGRTYQSLDDVEKRMDSVADGHAAAQWLVSVGWAHPRRIACMGGSYGGYMTLAELTSYPDAWAAGVALYGIANFVTFLENTHPFRRRHREAEYGSLERDREVLERVSPIRLLHQIKAPLLAVHGDMDPRVPVSETEQLVAALAARGIPTEFIRFPDEGHGIVRPPNRQKLYPAIAAFLEKHLAGQ